MDTVYPADPRVALLRAIVESAPVSIILSDPCGKITLVNRECEHLFGYSRDELIGQSVDVLVPGEFQASHANLRAGFLAKPVARRMGVGRQLSGRRRDGSLVPIEIGLTPIESGEGLFVLSIAIDLSEHKRLEEEIRTANAQLERRVRDRTLELEQANREKESHLAKLEEQRMELERLSREDPLTGLSNRRDVDARLGLEIKRCERAGSSLAIAMLDLDLFKKVNDKFGHALGDEVLRETAELIRLECRAEDVVGRYGGEEFVLVLPGSALRGGVAFCERVRAAVESFQWTRLGSELAITVSIGVSEWRPGRQAMDLLAEADARLYEAKHRGRNRVEPAMGVADASALASDLHGS